MDQLTAITDRLAKEDNISASITNGTSFQVVCKNKTGAQMAAESGSVVEWFNTLLSSTPKITVQLRRRNGTSQINDGLPIVLTVQPIDQPGLQGLAPTHQAHPISSMDPIQGLMGMIGLKGIFHHMDYPNKEAENTVLKAENVALKEKIMEMKEAALESRFSEDKAAGNKDMLNGIISVLPQLLPLLGKSAPAAAPGLGMPEPQEDLSESKLILIEAVTANQDFISDYLFAILNGMNTNPEFGKEQIELLKKYNLITN